VETSGLKVSDGFGLDFLVKLCVNNGWSPRYRSVLQLKVWPSSFKSQLPGFNSQIYRPRACLWGFLRSLRRRSTVPLSSFKLQTRLCCVYVPAGFLILVPDEWIPIFCRTDLFTLPIRRSLCFGILRRVVLQEMTDILEMNATSVIREMSDLALLIWKASNLRM
jgi:hypothetical protein